MLPWYLLSDSRVRNGLSHFRCASAPTPTGLRKNLFAPHQMLVGDEYPTVITKFRLVNNDLAPQESQFPATLLPEQQGRGQSLLSTLRRAAVPARFWQRLPRLRYRKRE